MNIDDLVSLNASWISSARCGTIGAMIKFMVVRTWIDVSQTERIETMSRARACSSTVTIAFRSKLSKAFAYNPSLDISK
jgi:hypothetical protein